MAPIDSTLLSLGTDRLSALWTAVLEEDLPPSVRDLFATLLGPSGRRSIAEGPLWPSDITDDHTPFEFSVALSGTATEVRILVEAQGASPTLAANAASARALNQKLAELGADLDRFHRIEDLFLPESSSGRFVLWHAASLLPQRRPVFRAYLNPRVRGAGRSHELVEAAFHRLGLSNAWPYVCAAAWRSPPADELRYFSIDLSNDARARVKVYIYHYGAGAPELERAASVAKNYVAGAATEFCEAMAGTTGPFVTTPPATCLAFVEGESAPAAATLHVPIRFYCANDRVGAERIRGYLEKHGLPAPAYDRALEAIARRPLDTACGIQTYASLRSERGRPRVTIYLATEAFSGHPTRAPAVRARAAATPRPAEIVEQYERDSIVYHPFFQRMRREPVDVGTLWKLLVNIREGIVANFTRRLAHVIARTEDVRIRSILAKQLNDELGAGDASRAHSLLFDRLVDGLEPWRPSAIAGDLLAPGREMSRRLEELYVHRDALEGVGASMVIEILGKQADCFIGDEFRRQSDVPKAALEWLDLHEQLEQEHSSESLDLARLLPEGIEAHAAAWRGARECGAAAWSFLDGMYAACYA